MFLPFALFALAAGPAVPADVVFTGGKIWTVDAATPQVEALAVRQGRIVVAGTNAQVEAVVGPKTVVVELRGHRVIPGVYDSHVHWLGGGMQLARVELKDAKDEAEFGRRLAEFDGKLPRDRWMLGGNWDHDRAFAGKLPTAATIDRFVKNRPVFLRRYDGHMAVVNTAALKLANVTAETKDPAGGVIERLADGKTPSGVLKDNAMDLVDKLVPEPGDDEIAEAVRASMLAAAAVGVTSVQDMEGSSPATRRKLLRVLQQLARRGELTCRIDVRWPIGGQKELTDLGIEGNFGGDFVRVGGVKGFVDGSLGSSTAKMFDPYVLDTKTAGVYVTEPPLMQELVTRADKAGLSVAIHAIGDEANAKLLDLFAAAVKANGPRDRRFRIEHAQHLRVADYGRFKESGVIASMQPFHVADDGRWAVGRIGETRCASSYAFKSLSDAGAKLAFGSDWPVAPLDPFVGIDAAVTRRTLDGKNPGGWFPEQRITVAQAVEAYTLGSAYAAHQEADRGTLSVGKLADFVVLSQDIFDAKEIGETKAVLTVVAGKVVFERK
jgi:predicted amidohydrolase YtcJ